MRDRNMFNFLVSDAPSKSVGLDTIGEFAKQAAMSFFGKEKVSLNSSVQKIASSENLTPEQIQLLCQESNKVVHAQMFKTAEDKYIEFEIADPKAIVNQLDVGQEKVGEAQLDDWGAFSKTASVNTIDQDYNFAPSEKRAYAGADFAMTKTKGHDGLYDKSSWVKKASAEKLAHQLQNVKDDQIMLGSQIQNAEKHFIKTARNHMLAFSLQDRRDQMPFLAKFCKLAGLEDERMKGLLGLLDHVMVRQGLLEKSADIKADASLISENLDARIQNGTHPLEKVIKTVLEKDKQKDILNDKHNLIQTQMAGHDVEGTSHGEKVRNL